MAHHRHFLLVCLTCITLTTFLNCAKASSEDQKAQHKQRATDYAENGRFKEAVIEYQNLVKLDPKDAEARYQLAVTHLKLNDQEHTNAAYKELLNTVTLDSRHEKAQLTLAKIYLAGREPLKAREHAEAVLTSSPQNADGLSIKGQSLVNEGKVKEGITEIKKAITADPRNILLHLQLAQAYAPIKDWKSAEAAVQQALAIDPNSLMAQVTLADIYTMSNRLSDAQVTLQRALEKHPEAEVLYMNLGGIYRAERKYSEAEALYQKWSLVSPKNSKPFIVMGDFYQWSGQMEKAHASFQRALEADPASTDARDAIVLHYLDAGKLSEAETRIQAILSANAKDWKGRLFDARLRLVQGKTDEAIPILQKLIKEEPKHPFAHYYLGLAWAVKSDWSQATAELTEAMQLAPKVSEIRANLAKAHLAKGATELALEQAQAALRLNPRNVIAALTLGDAYLMKGDIAKGKDVFEAVAKALPKLPLMHHRLGLIALSEKKENEALAHFEAALDIDQNYVDSLSQIVNLSITHKKAAEARDRLARHIERSPDNPGLHILMGRVWIALQDIPKAESSFKKAIALDEKSSDAYAFLSILYVQAGKVDQAIQESEAAVAQSPKAFVPRIMLAMLHEQKKDYTKAMAGYEEVLKINPRSAQAANNLAYLLLEHGGNSDLALSYAQTAREINPADPYIADTLGWIYYRKNVFLKSLTLLKEAALKLPTSPDVQYHYGMAEWKNGNKVRAKKALDEALKMSSVFAGADEARSVLKQL